MAQQRYDSYVICTAPRSGSTMLCKLLAATNVAGNPGSLFHEPALEAWLAYYGLQERSFPTRGEALDAVFSAALARGKGETNVFGLRLQRSSFDFFMEQLAARHPDAGNDPDRIAAEYGRTLYIYLQREDRLDQAISRLRAEQTGLWHMRADGTELERQEPSQEDGYDPAAIKAHMAEHTKLFAAWEAWFAEHGIDPLRVTYEGLAAAPRKVLAEILAALGLEASLADGVAPQTRKLADETNLAWRSRFERDMGLP